MIYNKEHIDIFINRSWEKNIDTRILSDKSFIIPRNKIHEYVERIIDIPYAVFVDYIKENKGIIDDEQLTQSSNFFACSSEMCRAIELKGNPGLKYVEIGKLFPQYIKKNNDIAFRKYGENQIKTSTQLGLTFEYYNYWYLTCVGYIYNDLNFQQQESLLARTILRIPLYQDLLLNIIKNDVFLTDYMNGISQSTQGRRAGSILRLLKICLDECTRNGIKYYNIHYPVYVSRIKSIRYSLFEGTANNLFDMPREESSIAAEEQK